LLDPRSGIVPPAIPTLEDIRILAGNLITVANEYYNHHPVINNLETRFNSVRDIYICIARVTFVCRAYQVVFNNHIPIQELRTAPTTFDDTAIAANNTAQNQIDNINVAIQNLLIVALTAEAICQNGIIHDYDDRYRVRDAQINELTHLENDIADYVRIINEGIDYVRNGTSNVFGMQNNITHTEQLIQANLARIQRANRVFQ
jgi:hypothetical protein